MTLPPPRYWSVMHARSCLQGAGGLSQTQQSLMVQPGPGLLGAWRPKSLESWCSHGREAGSCCRPQATPGQAFPPVQTTLHCTELCLLPWGTSCSVVLMLRTLLCWVETLVDEQW